MDGSMDVGISIYIIVEIEKVSVRPYVRPSGAIGGNLQQKYRRLRPIFFFQNETRIDASVWRTQLCDGRNQR